eukprot:GFUD01040565.1.p1 GENE.GFUD01040565.1~~GFUD01040565.1.p1  ORF type:complete len:108 (+),score=19.84 GFUD01040565.1:195-518(+)
MNGCDPEGGTGPSKNVRLNSVAGVEPNTSGRKCPSWLDNFNIYFTLGMIGFFGFWGTLLLHIWPPSRYWPEWALWSSEDGEDNNSVPTITITTNISSLNNNSVLAVR